MYPGSLLARDLITARAVTQPISGDVMELQGAGRVPSGRRADPEMSVGTGGPFIRRRRAVDMGRGGGGQLAVYGRAGAGRRRPTVVSLNGASL